MMAAAFFGAVSGRGGISEKQREDVQGVRRGKCLLCRECPQFLVSPPLIACSYCGCPPAKHEHIRKGGGTKRRRDPVPSDSVCSLSDTELSDSSGLSSPGVGVKWRPWHQVTSPPPRLETLLEREPVSREEALEHAWSREDTSPNIYVKNDDPLTFHRNPVYQTSDAIRGRGISLARRSSAGLGGGGRRGPRSGYLNGLHVWAVHWPQESRGTHPVVGVATRECPLTEPGYKRLVGSNCNSWGWCLKSLKIFHDSDRFRKGVTYPRDVDEKLNVPDTFFMILDCDRGTLAFQVEDDYLGVAFSGLRCLELFPIVSAVWGHCEVTLTYINSHELEEE